MKLIDNHRSAFAVTAEKETEEIRKSAAVLTGYLEKITSCRLPIVPADEKPAKNTVVLDVFPFAYPLDSADGLGEEGFVLAEKDGTVYLYAASEESLSYAVYDFLERFGGCLWLTSADDFIPQMDSVEIPDGVFIKELPAMNYREVYYRDAWDRVFAQKLKLNGQNSAVVNGRVAEGHRNWGFWCHSFFSLISPGEYYEKHPEYFSLVDGKRIRNGQLCCTNDEMIGEAIKNLRKYMEKRPDVKYWSVSQNDTAGACTCEKCRKYDSEAGSPIGSILYFINRVAEAFPDKVISTLSYQYSRTAPKKIAMRDNVHIMLCDIECDRSEPIAVNVQCESFKHDLTVWHRYCGNVFLWDYDIQFSNLIAPFPNFHVLAENMKFFYENNVRSVFNQANRENRGDFWALRAYLLAKLSWNPYCDYQKHYREFLSAYYGPAADAVDRYIRAMTDARKAAGEGLSIFGQPEQEAFLSEQRCREYLKILEEALAAVPADSIYVPRLEEIRLGLIYVMLKCGYGNSSAERDEMTAFFLRVSREIGLERVREWDTSPEEFISG